MNQTAMSAPLISGVGICSAIGQNQDAFFSALIAGKQCFGAMQREGRVPPVAGESGGPVFIGAEINKDALVLPELINRRVQRNASWTALLALKALHEAWQDAQLDKVDSTRIGLIVGGSNVQQRELMLMQQAYRGKEHFIKPSYALQFMDTDICGFCTELFGIHGFAFSVGGASASGQMAVIQAANAVASGQVDVCIATGAMMDLSYWECLALKSAGAMGGEAYADAPDQACRPFDEAHNGFIYGENCGVVVIESAKSVAKRNAKAYAKLAGWGLCSDGKRNSDPSLNGETQVIQTALSHAGLTAKDIDYVNPHGTASIIGDNTEVEALQASQLNHALINTTKSITGHGLTAAGAVEIVATALQMQHGKLHPSLNLENPINNDLNWVGAAGAEHAIQHALSLSLGFGGVNTAVCLSQTD